MRSSTAPVSTTSYDDQIFPHAPYTYLPSTDDSSDSALPTPRHLTPPRNAFGPEDWAKVVLARHYDAAQRFRRTLDEHIQRRNARTKFITDMSQLAGLPAEKAEPSELAPECPVAVTRTSRDLYRQQEHHRAEVSPEPEIGRVPHDVKLWRSRSKSGLRPEVHPMDKPTPLTRKKSVAEYNFPKQGPTTFYEDSSSDEDEPEEGEGRTREFSHRHRRHEKELCELTDRTTRLRDSAETIRPDVGDWAIQSAGAAAENAKTPPGSRVTSEIFHEVAVLERVREKIKQRRASQLSASVEERGEATGASFARLWEPFEQFGRLEL